MLSVREIELAQKQLDGVAERTPLIYSHTFSRLTGAEVYLKAENTQRTGSFKIRGAYFKISSLKPAEQSRGVIAASAGNHAQGVAIAASVAGITSVVVMPETASLAKVSATKDYGADVILYGRSYDEALAYALEVAETRGLVFIPPFDDWQVMAGQGTVGLEIMEMLPDVDLVVVPVGGGGLIAGIATAVKARSRRTKVIGVQAAAVASCYESFRRGAHTSVAGGSTIADGIAIRSCGKLAFQVIERRVDDIVVVEEDAIAHSLVMLLERCKLLVEGAGAVGLAAMLSGRVKAPGQKAVIVLSGGNIDVNLVAHVIEHGLTSAGRFLVIRARMPDQPGQLAGLVRILAEKKVNILQIEHHRAGLPLPLNQAEVELTLETRDPQHCAEILRAVREAGFDVWRAWE